MQRQCRFAILALSYVVCCLFSFCASALALPPVHGQTKPASETAPVKSFDQTEAAYKATMQLTFLENYAYTLTLRNPNAPTGRRWAFTFLCKRPDVRAAPVPPPPGEFASLNAPEIQRWVSRLPPGTDIWYQALYDFGKGKRFLVRDRNDPEYDLIDLFRVCQSRGKGVRLCVNQTQL